MKSLTLQPANLQPIFKAEALVACISFVLE